MTTLTIVVGTYNRREMLMRCIGAITNQLDVGHEVCIIDAGSTDGTVEFLRGVRGLKIVLDGERVGQAASLNRVFRELVTDYVCWLSDDNVVQDSALREATSIMDRYPTIGLVTLKTRDVIGPNATEPYIGGIWPAGVLNCNQGMIRTDLLQELGGFDEDFRDYGIDADLTTRVLLKGFRVVYTKRVAIHHFRDHDASSWVEPPERKQRLENSIQLYCQKYEKLIEQVANLPPQPRSNLLRCFSAASRSLTHCMPGRMRYSQRDWQNVTRCPFISQWDLLLNSTKLFYLDQKIPAHILGDSRDHR